MKKNKTDISNKEIIINNRLRIKDFSSLREIVYNYLHSNQGKHPIAIRVNFKQLSEYKGLFYGQVYSIMIPELIEYMGIPLILHDK